MLQTLSTAYRSWAFKVTIWLILAAIAAGLTFMVWVASAVKPVASATKKGSDNPLVKDPVALLAQTAPEETKDFIKPITFDAVIRDMRNYPAEFKDSRFIKDNTGKWTLQVMNVIEHDIITNYLDNNADKRSKFNYFRIVDENNQKRFVLTYGIFNSLPEAQAASKTVAFNLPSNISVFPEQFKSYAPQMDEYEVTPPLRDTGKNAPRAVKLKNSDKPLPAPKAPKSATQDKPAQKPAAADKPKPVAQKPSIEKSSNQNDTLNIEENRAKPAANVAPNPDLQPLKPKKSEPPALTDEPPVKEKPVKEKPVNEPPKEKPVKEKPAKESDAGTTMSQKP